MSLAQKWNNVSRRLTTPHAVWTICRWKQPSTLFLGGLDAEKRNIFVRRYWYLDSVADIAKRYGISESKVKTTLFRCRNRLREHLNKEGYTV